MTTPTYPIPIPLDAIAEFCKRNHIRKLSLFGSILRDDFGPDSDVDVLVEFEEGKTPGLEYFTMGDELSELLGRRLDFLTEQGISRYFVAEVLAQARPLYVARGTMLVQ
ncbi:MAG: nucleotidyltransferase family protein [Tepidiformaceae bacterium]